LSDTEPRIRGVALYPERDPTCPTRVARRHRNAKTLEPFREALDVTKRTVQRD